MRESVNQSGSVVQQVHLLSAHNCSEGLYLTIVTLQLFPDL